MLYTEVFLSGIAILVALLIAFINIATRFKFNLNKTLALIAALLAVEFFIIFTHILNIEFDVFPLVLKGRIFIAFILYMMQCFFHLIHIYPDKKVMPVLWFFIVTGTPGLIFTIITIFTDYVIKDVKVEQFIILEFGDFFWIYLVLFIFYLLAIFFVILQKFRQSETSVLTQDLLYFIGGFITVFLFMFIFSFFLPFIMQIYDFFFLGIIISGILILLILNYGIYDYSNLDFKKFYFDLISLLIIFIILIVPVLFILLSGESLIFQENISLVGVSLLVVFYLTISVDFLRSKAKMLFLLNYNKLIKNFKNLFMFTEQISASEDLSLFWDSLFRNAFDVLKDRYSILNANLFIYNRKGKNFIYLYGYGSEISTEILNESHGAVKCFELHPLVLEKSMLYSNIIFDNYKSETLELFNKYQIELALPFINYERKIFAFLLLGGLPSFDIDYITGLPKKRFYTKTFIAAFEVYRINFQRQLLHGMMLEEIREKQISEHDRMVISTVKKRIVPKKIEHIEGIRISSFNINNSIQGGDYFDSIKINNNNICIFMSDLSYSGIDSAILGLELFSVFHTQIKFMNNSDSVLNIMNWIVSTAKFSNKYAPAFCLFYSNSGQISFSNAAFNPLLVYNPEMDEFITYETKGVPIGVDKDFIYESSTARLKPGYIGLLYSKGLTGAIGSKGENFPLDSAKEIIRDVKGESPAVITRVLYKKLNDHIKDVKQTNDISVIVFKVQSIKQ